MNNENGAIEANRSAQRPSWRSHNLVFAAIVFTITSCVVGLNFFADPLLIFHKPWVKPLYSTNERARIPGFLRNLDYDAAIVGASTAMAVTSADARDILGVQPVVLVMGGATIGEQGIVIEHGLRTGRIKKVIWLIDAVTFSFPTFRWDAPFPMELYDGGLASRLQYLFSRVTLVSALDVIGYWVTGKVPDGFETNLDGLYDSHFPDLSGYSDEAVRAAFTSDVALRTLRDREANFLITYDPQNVETLFDRYIVSAALRYPNVEFEFVLSPATTAWMQYLERYFPARLEQHFLVRKLAYEKIPPLRNAYLYDLQAEAAIVNDYHNFSDMLHFSRSVGRHLLGRIRHRLSDSADGQAAADAGIRLGMQSRPLP